MCELKQDIDILPAGDETEIGEKGFLPLSLSLHVHLFLPLNSSCHPFELFGSRWS